MKVPGPCFHNYEIINTIDNADIVKCTKCDHKHAFVHKSLDYLDFVLKINKYEGIDKC